MQEGQGRRRPCHWTIYQKLCQLIIRRLSGIPDAVANFSSTVACASLHVMISNLLACMSASLYRADVLRTQRCFEHQAERIFKQVQLPGQVEQA